MENAVYCPVQKIISVIQSKWMLFILKELMGGKKRFGQLRRSLLGVSPKTLSLRLKELEEAGIVKRTIFAEVPPRVEYELTEKGASLGKVIELMSKWSEKWMVDGSRTASIEAMEPIALTLRVKPRKQPVSARV